MKLAKDKWLSFDKLEHIAGGVLAYFLLHWLLWTAPNYWVFIVSAVLGGHLWEIKDSKLSWKQWGGFGGDGYSFKDLAATIVGGLIGWWLWKLRLGPF